MRALSPWKKHWKKLRILLFSFSAIQCGVDTSTDLMLTVEMQGNFEAPLGSTGSFEPISQTFELEKIIITQIDGTETDLYAQASTEITIIDRPLKIFEYVIPDTWSGLIMQKFTLQFKSEVIGESLHKDDHMLTLPTQYPLETSPSYSTTTDLSYASFPIEVGKSLSFVAYANWKETVIRDETGATPVDTMENPTLSITLLEQD